MTLVQGACNNFSTVGLWGCCLAVKKDAFVKVGMFTKNAIIEDADLALKLNKNNYTVEQSFYPVHTNVPYKFKSWFKQKIRWYSSFFQCIFRYFYIYLKHPITVSLAMFSVLSTFLSIILLKNNLIVIKDVLSNIFLSIIDFTTFKHILNILYSFLPFLLNLLIATVLYPLLGIQYIIFNIKNKSQKLKDILLIYPYTFIYLPMLFIVYFISFFIGVYKLFKLKEEDTGWKG
jgi:cellulose synthase/poly-beta-1,6-N-acetylglucosamine synthase-like glycosyltransferase